MCTKVAIGKPLLNLLERLTEAEQDEVKDFVLHILQDPDFIGVTPEQAIELNQIKTNMDNGEYYTHNEVFGE